MSFPHDIRAEISVLPATRTEKFFSSQGTSQQPPTGVTVLCTFGTLTILLQFNKQCFKWTFTGGAVSQSLCGSDFIRAHSILVDVKDQCLIHPLILPQSPCTASLEQHSIWTPLPQLVTSLPSFWLVSLMSPLPHLSTPLPNIV